MSSSPDFYIIDQRTKGQVPVSIGTSLALEGFVGILEDKGVAQQGPVPFTVNDELWINVRTLFRNLEGAIDKGVVASILPGDFATAIIEEMTIIREWLKTATGNKFNQSNVFFYYCTYKSLGKFYPYAIIKEPATEKQKFYVAMENASLKNVHDILSVGLAPNQQSSVLKGFDVTIHGNGKTAAVLSHYPIDLLNFVDVKSLTLLESHTGACKTRPHWYTKLKNGGQLPRIPFDRMTIQLFGDSSGVFTPQAKDQRDRIMEIADTYKWTALTTKDRILQSIHLSKEPILEGNVKKLYA